MDASMIMSSFEDRTDSFPSLFGSFESTFSSSVSASSCDELSLCTPRRDLADPFEMDDFQSTMSLRSNTTSPLDTPSYDISMNFGIPDQNAIYATPTKVSMNMMTYEGLSGYNMYSPAENQDFMNHTPGLAYDLSSPTQGMYTPSPRSFVVPSQTFLEAYEPSTPIPMTRLNFSSPMSPSPYGSMSQQQKAYFITPPPNSARSSVSSSSSMQSMAPRMMESSSILHRVQGSNRVRKERKLDSFNVNVVPGGQFRCDHPGCKSDHAFKRQEHLKRHKKTHMAQKDLNCQFCHKKFQQDRSDNYRSHVKLHSDPDKKGSRTKYFPGAAELVDKWAKDKSRASLAPAAQISPSRSSSRML